LNLFNALQNHLSYGRVRNRDGKFVAASLEGIGAAVSRALKIGDDSKVSIVNATGPDVYPISSFTWIVLPAHSSDDTKRNPLIGSLQWVLVPGQRQAAALGYLPLPADITKKGYATMARLKQRRQMRRIG
jgi:phosphate transport system substrate-binding protein